MFIHADDLSILARGRSFDELERVLNKRAVHYGEIFHTLEA